MTVDVVKPASTAHVETSSDPSTTQFLVEFAQVIKLIEAATPAIQLVHIHCRFVVNGNWKCDYDINGIARTFNYVTDISVMPHLVKTTSNDWFTEEERSTIERIHQEVEHLRFVHTLVEFEWTNN